MLVKSVAILVPATLTGVKNALFTTYQSLPTPSSAPIMKGTFLSIATPDTVSVIEPADSIFGLLVALTSLLADKLTPVIIASLAPNASYVNVPFVSTVTILLPVVTVV